MPCLIDLKLIVESHVHFEEHKYKFYMYLSVKKILYGLKPLFLMSVLNQRVRDIRVGAGRGVIHYKVFL